MDFPTNRLALYRQLLESIHKQYSALNLSITVLPTWQQSREFSQLLPHINYYVLQVHEMEKPRSIDVTVKIFDANRLPAYISKASSFKKPFYIALPTYGMRLIFDKNGAFKAMSAEGGSEAPPPGYRQKIVMSDADSIARSVKALRNTPPAHCLGIIWFRMPVESDQLNWTWPALTAVMAGRAPKVDLSAEVTQPKPGLYEVRIKNNGEQNPVENVQIALHCSADAIVARDALSGFSLSNDLVLTGPAPRIGTTVLAAWVRLHNTTEQLTAGKVALLP